MHRACFVFLKNLFAWVPFLFLPALAASPDHPNIILILADDLGGTDLGCYGSTFYQTPALDQLARESARFTQAYAAAPVCSPTRASILTGKYPARLHLTDWLPGRPDQPSQKVARPAIEQQLPNHEVTLAAILKKAGYSTASIGKWHLGGPGSLPENHGFDLNIGGNAAGSPPSYFFPYQNPKKPAQKIPGLSEGSPGEYLTDRLTQEATQFIRAHRDQPFFLYLAHYAVHIPLGAPTNLVQQFQSQPKSGSQTNAIYAAMISRLDAGVAQLLLTLDELHLRENTIVLFTSDNGGLSVKEGPHTPATSNDPLRAGKGFLYEGGLRVPLIISWKNKIPPSTLSAPVASIDILPTLLDLAQLRAFSPAPTNIDGISLSPILSSSSGDLKRPALFWHYPHYSNQGGKPGGAIRLGDLKLIDSYEDGHLELYDLKNDPSEITNLSLKFPDKAAALESKLDAWRRLTSAQMPHPNPAYQTQNPIEPDADGLVFLPASKALTHGTTIRYEPQPHKNTVGYWTNAKDWISWRFFIPRPGHYLLEILQGCGKGSGGSEVSFQIDAQKITTTVLDTGGFQNFRARQLAPFHFDKPGLYTMEVRALSKPGLAVMDLRNATLRPLPD